VHEPSRAARRRQARTGTSPAWAWPVPRLSWRDIVPVLVLGVVGLAVYHNSFAGPFMFDDICAIPNNQRIRRLWPPWEALSPPAHCTIEGRPLVNLSLAFNYAVGGLNVWGYHAFNLAVHVLAALTLFGSVRRTLAGVHLRRGDSDTAGPWSSVVGLDGPPARNRGTSPIQRTESLMGLCYLLTIYCVIRGHAAAGRYGWYAAAIAACAMGMACKEVMVTAPVAVLLYDRCFLSTSFREALRERWGLYAGLAGTWLVLAAAQITTSHPTAGFDLEHLRPWHYAMTQPGVILRYLRLSFWPAPLVIDYYGWPIARHITPAAVVVAGLLVATLWVLYRRPAIGFLGAWFFLILAPTSSILPLAGEPAAERRMYLPLAAIVVLVVVGAHAAMEAAVRGDRLSAAVRQGIQVALVSMIVVILGVVTLRRNEDYRSLISIWQDVATKRPDNARAHMNLGHYLAEERRIDEAQREYAEAVRSEPNNPDAHYGVAILLGQQGKLDDAIAEYSEVLRLNPDHAKAHNALGGVLSGRGQLAEAMQHYSEAVRIDPAYPEAHYNFALLLLRSGRTDEAIDQLESALEVRPGFVAARRLLEDARRGRARAGSQ
jgi:Tfp pilus assembly protein PilF